MRDWIRPAITIFIAAAIGVVVVHDIGQWAFAQLSVQGAAERIAQEAIRVYNATESRDTAGIAAVQAGKKEGVEVYGFDVKKGRLYVWVRMKPQRTWVVGRIVSDFETKTAAQAQYNDPLK